MTRAEFYARESALRREKNIVALRAIVRRGGIGGGPAHADELRVRRMARRGYYSRADRDHGLPHPVHYEQALA